MSAAVVVLLLGVGPTFGQTKDDVPELVKQLRDPDVFVRIKAAKSLGKVGSGARDSLPVLNEVILHDGDIDVRAVARNAVESIKLASMKELPESALEALKVLKKTGSKPAEKTKALEDIAALGPDGREATAELIEAMLQNPTSAFQPYLDTLEKIDPPLHKPVVALIFDKDNGKKNQVLDDLIKLGDEAEPTIPVLLTVYKTERVFPYKDPNQSICPKLIVAMSKIGGRNKLVGQTVLNVFTSNSPNERTARAAAIEAASAMDLESKNFVNFLMTALADPGTRLKAVEALGKLGPAAKPALTTLTKLKLDSDAGVRDAVAKAIEEIKGATK